MDPCLKACLYISAILDGEIPLDGNPRTRWLVRHLRRCNRCLLTVLGEMAHPEPSTIMRSHKERTGA